LAVDALGMPIRAIVTDGPRADCKEAIPLIQNLPCKVLLADRGYDSDKIIECAKNSGIQPVIPPKKESKSSARLQRSSL
jgi:transposase